MVIRIESWKVFSPTTMAYLLQKLGGYLEWLELVWIEPIYMMGPILRAERAWPTMHENLRDLAKQGLPGNIVFSLNVVYLCEIPIAIALTIVGSISALKQYHICRSEKKLGCVFATVFVKKRSARLTELSWLEF